MFCFLFVPLADPSGKVHPEITNKNGNPNYKYFYSTADQGNDPNIFSYSGLYFGLKELQLHNFCCKRQIFRNSSGLWFLFGCWLLLHLGISRNLGKKRTASWLLLRAFWFLFDQRKRRFCVWAQSWTGSRWDLVSKCSWTEVGNLTVLSLFVDVILLASSGHDLQRESVEVRVSSTGILPSS